MSTKFLASNIVYRSCNRSKTTSVIGSKSSEGVLPQSLMPKKKTIAKSMSRQQHFLECPHTTHSTSCVLR